MQASSSLPSGFGALPLAGQVAPDFDLPDSAGVKRCLSELTAAGPLVLLFYRGHW
jgi:peroxiredoxin